MKPFINVKTYNTKKTERRKEDGEASLITKEKCLQRIELSGLRYPLSWLPHPRPFILHWSIVPPALTNGKPARPGRGAIVFRRLSYCVAPRHHNSAARGTVHCLQGGTARRRIVQECGYVTWPGLEERQLWCVSAGLYIPFMLESSVVLAKSERKLRAAAI